MDDLNFCHVYCIFPCILKSVCSYLILVKMVQFFGRGLRQYDTFDRRKQQHKKSQNKIDEPPPDTERQCLLKLSIEAMHCNGISGGGGGVVIKLHWMEAFLMSSYASQGCLLHQLYSCTWYICWFFLPWSIVNRNNGLEEVVALLSNCIGWRRVSRYYNNDRGDYRTIASRSLQQLLLVRLEIVPATRLMIQIVPIPNL